MLNDKTAGETIELSYTEQDQLIASARSESTVVDVDDEKDMLSNQP